MLHIHLHGFVIAGVTLFYYIYMTLSPIQKSFLRYIFCKKIGTQCVHVASQKKHHDRMFIKQNETSSCNYLFLIMPTMQLLDLKSNG